MMNNIDAIINSEKCLSASGQVLNELSKNIPSAKFALLELVKNAYEAGANKVSIELKKNSLEIADNGKGMNEKSIDALLTIGYSKKKFGSIENGRLISGQKGLGFFSSFKFGKKVKLETIQDFISLSFELDYDEIIKSDNINDYKLGIKKNKSTIESGTRIVVSDLDQEYYNFLKESLSEGSSYQKLKNTILDDDFEIELKGCEYKETSYPEMCNYKTANLSFQKEIGEVIESPVLNFVIENIPFALEIPEEFHELINHDKIAFAFDITYFNFKKIRPQFSITDVNPLFYRSTLSKQTITPLVYINNALFDNYELYDVESNASKKSNEIIRQQIGFIKMNFYDNNIIDFNSDRTYMNESFYQRKIEKFLNFISSAGQSFIQAKLREIKERNPVFEKQYAIFSGDEISEISTYLSEIEKIYHNEIEMEEYDKNIVGNWKLVLKTGSKIYIHIKEFQLPAIRQLKNICNEFTVYNYDDLFLLYNSRGTIGGSIKPSISIRPSNQVSLDNQTNTLLFTHPGEFKVFLNVLDKKTCLSYKGEYIINVIQASKNTDSPNEESKSFINIILPTGNLNVKPDLHRFINEVNEIAYTDKYENIFVSAIRTLVELVIKDIDSIKKVAKDEGDLAPKYKRIIAYIISNYESEVVGEENKKVIRSAISEIKDSYMKDGFISFLNFTTHNGKRFYTREDILLRRQIFCLLVDYLSFIN